MKVCLIILLVVFAASTSGQNLDEVLRFGGTGDEPGTFKNPLAIDVSFSGIVYVVDTGNHRIQLFDQKGTFIKSIGGFGFAKDHFDTPRDIWVRSMINIYVSDYNNQRLVRYDRHMNFISMLERNDADPYAYQFYEVCSAALNGQNELFIVEHDENKVIKFSREGKPERAFGTIESGYGELERPQQIDLLPGNRIVISDTGKRALMIYDFFGSFIASFTDDQFQSPRGIGITPDGIVYVADPVAGQVFRVERGFTGLKRVILRGGEPLRQPQDIAFLKESDSAIKAYVLDGDRVVVGYLND